MALGSNIYTYIAVLFRPTQVSATNVVYTFGQTQAPVDTVMILYKDRFDPTRPGYNALVGNDDTSAATHQATVGGSVSIFCGTSSYCPQISQTITPAQIAMGQPYTLLISTYSPGTGSSLGINQTFYSSGPGDFGSLNNMSPINTAKPYYRLFDLDFLVRPDFEGGILRVDTTGYSYGQNFTLSGQASNTLDTYGNNVTFSGVFSNAVAGTPGVLTITNSVAGGSVTLSGASTFTGGLTIGQNALVNISAANNLGAESARLTLNGGTLNTGSSGISTSRPVTVGALGGTISNSGLFTLGGVIDGSGNLTKNGSGTLTLTGNSSYAGTISVNAGTLQIGSGGTTGSLSGGSIVNSTAVVFNRSDTSTYGGAISGSGSLTKQGSGTLILTGSNVHTGGTTISGGAIQIGSGGTTGSLAGNVTNNGLLVFNRSDDITFAGVISGSGAVSQSGSGTLTLTGSNSYTGNTSFNSGVISVSSSANLGGATGNAMIFNSGTLRNTAAMSLARAVTLNSTGGRIDTSAALTLSGVISGSGLLTKIGADTLTLTGANTHTGGTTITAGTLQIGSGGTSGSITGNILNNAALVFNRSDSSGYTGAISGSGIVTKTGAGTLTLSGTSSYTGGTAINAGILSITNGGALGAGTVTNSATLNLDYGSASTLGNVLAGTGALTKTGAGVATLTGGGTASAVSVNAGTLTYGQSGIFTAASHVTANAATTSLNSISRLAVTNAFTQDSGSTLSVVLDGTAVARITAGTANLGGTLNISGFTGTPAARASEVADYKALVISTTGGLTGDFSLVNSLASSVDYLTLTGYKTNGNKDYAVGFGLTWFAGTPKGNGVFTLANAGDTFDVDVVLNNQSAVAATGWDGGSLTKAGAGTLILSRVNTYSGATTINAGTLRAGIVNAFAQSNSVIVASGATLDLNGFAQTAQNLSGAGTVTLGSAALTAQNTGNTVFSGVIGGSGSLTKTGTGTLTLSGTNTYTGGTTVTAGTLQIGNGGTSGSIAGNIVNNAALIFNRSNSFSYSGVISGSGTVTKTGAGTLTLSGINTYAGGTTVSAGILTATSGSALGTGTVTNNATLNLDFGSASTLANVLAGTGALTKTGAGIATLTGGGSAGAVSVNAGTLTYGQSGIFTAASHVTANAAKTTLNSVSRLAVTNAFTQNSGSTLSVALGGATGARITAGTANLGGVLNITGFTGAQAVRASEVSNSQATIISTTGGLTGDFSSVDLGGAGSTVDYLTLAGYKTNGNKDYAVGFGLTWFAGATKGNGVFTLADATTFDVDVVLGNQSAVAATGWDGRSLTKAGAGTLILSATNTYTGATTINGGALRTGIANAFAQSTSVNVASGATLDLNGFSQTAQNLAGAGTVTLGSATLTAQNTGNTAFSGEITGSGHLTKTGTGTLTLSGVNTYAGGTTVSAGTLTATGGNALGLGTVTNNATLNLDFASASTLGNILAGTGALTNTGAGIATLTGGGTAGAVSVNAGTLAFGQSGLFTAASYTTANGAATTLGGASRLSVVGGFTQDAGSTLNINVGSLIPPAIAAGTATLDGTLNITGFTGTQATLASTLLSSQVNVIHSTNNIIGDFSSISFAGAPSSHNYLMLTGWKSADNKDYNVGFGLSWHAGTVVSHGGFNLVDASDVFNVDIALVNQAASLTGWSGQSLGKRGDGTLILSATNTYTGMTNVHEGTLQIGNGGTTGSVAGNIANDAALVFNRSDIATYGGVISGVGSLAQAGSGTLVLTGANTYTGATLVDNGILQAGATNVFAASGSMNVASGATLNLNNFNQTINNLSGEGFVTLGSATLTANNSADTAFAGMMTGAGNLVKTGTAALQLTNSNDVIGDVDVRVGQLALNQTGTLNATGDYTTRNGATTVIVGEQSQLTVGGVFTLEAGATLSVTVGSAPDIVADTAALDGALTLQGFSTVGGMPVKASDVVNGQTYTLIKTTNGITGDFVATPLQSSGLDYVLYEGSVSRDGLDYKLGFKLAWTDGGPVSSSGKFTLDSGTAFDVDVVLADQANAFTSGWDGKELLKEGAGLLVLSAANSYTGGTTINDGTLQVSSDANLGDASGSLTFNGGSLATIASFTSDRHVLLKSGFGTFDVANDTILTLTGGLTGAGGMIKTEIGKLILEGDSSYTGATVVDAGALIAGKANAFSAHSDHTIHLGAVLALQGYDQTIANLDNAGNLHIGSGDGSRIGGALTVTGAYTSNGGNLFLNTVLGGDGSLTDRLIVGAVEMGTQGVSLLGSGEYASATKVYITNVGGLGAKTAGDGIEIVHVMDPSRSAENAFILGTRVAAGAYDYALYQGGVGGASSDGNWYLRTVDVGYRPETVINGTVPQTIARLGLSMLGGYSGRDDEGFNISEESETEDPRCQDPVYARKAPHCLRLPKTFRHETVSRAAWARLIGETGEASYGGKTEAARIANFEKHGASYTYSMAGFVAGMDLLRQTGSDGSSDIAGIYVGAGRITSDVRNIYGGGNSGSSTTDGYSVGAYWRHGWASGFYIDAALQGTYYGAIETKSNAGQKMNTHGWAVLGSLEGGYQMKLSDGWTIEPQAQVIYQHGSVENSSDAYGRIKFHDTDAYYARVGVRVQKEWVRENGLKMQMFGRANLWHSFGPDAKTTFTSLDGTNPVTLGSQTAETWAQFSIGLGGQLSRNTTVFVSGDYNLPLGDNKGYSVGGRVGMKVVW